MAQLSHADVEVREVAVASLHQVLVKSEVLQTAAESSGLAATMQRYWEKLLDRLLDDEPSVVSAAVAAATDIVELGQRADAAAPEGFLLQRLGSLCAARMAAALGPMLESCSCAQAPAQTSIARLLLLLVRQLLHRPQPGGGAVPLRAGGGEPMMLPGLGSLVPSACAFLHERVGAADTSLRLECCRALLMIMAMTRAAAEASSGDVSSSVPPFIAVAVPETWASDAVASLLELEHRQLGEAALPDVARTIARNLSALPVAVRSQVVRQLLPLVSCVSDVPCRMEVYALVWSEVMAEEVQSGGMAAAAGGGGSGLSLSNLLTDPYVGTLIKGLHGTQISGGHESGGIVKAAIDAAKALGTAALGAIGAVGDVAGDVAQTVKDTATSTAGEAKYVALKAADTAGDVGSSAAASGSGAVSTAGAAVSTAGAATKKATGEVASEAAQKAKTAAASAGNVVADWYGSAKNKISGGGSKEGSKGGARPVGEGEEERHEAWREEQHGSLYSQGIAEGKDDPAPAPSREGSGGGAKDDEGKKPDKKSGGFIKSLKGNIKSGLGIGHRESKADRESEKEAGKEAAATVAATQAATANAAAAAAEQLEKQKQSGPSRSSQDKAAAGGTGAGTASAPSHVVMMPAAPGANVVIAPPELTTAVPPGKKKGPSVPGLTTHRHEVVVTLLDAVVQRASDFGVMELCLSAQAAAVRDQAVLANQAGQDRVLRWVRLARETLQATQACVWWEPVVTPAITTSISHEADDHAAADFSSVPSDVWLQLLQVGSPAVHCPRHATLMYSAPCHRLRATPPTPVCNCSRRSRRQRSLRLLGQPSMTRRAPRYCPPRWGG